MSLFDHDYVAEVVRRLGQLGPDAQPSWGSFTRADLVRHLAAAIRFSMGKGRPVEDRSTWWRRNVVAPLIMRGVLRLPRNVTFPQMNAAVREQDDLETLHALLEDYLNLVQADELRPAIHPHFGDIGVDGWARLHVVHFEHHLRQFRV